MGCEFLGANEIASVFFSSHWNWKICSVQGSMRIVLPGMLVCCFVARMTKSFVTSNGNTVLEFKISDPIYDGRLLQFVARFIPNSRIRYFWDNWLEMFLKMVYGRWVLVFQNDEHVLYALLHFKFGNGFLRGF